MSHALSAALVGRGFALSFEAHRRRRYSSPEQARGKLERQRRELFAQVQALSGPIEAALREAFGEALRSLSGQGPGLFARPTLALERLPASLFPLDLEWRGQALALGGEPGAIDLRWTIGGPCSSQSLTALDARLQALFDQAPPAGPGVETRRVGVSVVEERWGIYAGLRGFVPRDLAAAFQGRCRILAERAAALFRDRAPGDGLGLGVEPEPLMPVLGGRYDGELDRAFNFWGPLVDGEAPSLMRTARDRGLYRVIALVAVEEANWGQVNAALGRALSEALSEERDGAIEAEDRRALLEDAEADPEEQYAVLRSLEGRPSADLTAALSGVLRRAAEADGLCEAVLEVLSRASSIDEATIRAVLGDRARSAAQRQLAAELLGRHHTVGAASELFACALDAEEEWNTRCAARDAFVTIAEAARDDAGIQEMAARLDAAW